MRLLALGFQGGRGAGLAAKGGGSVSVTGRTVACRDFDVKWNEMLARLKDYRVSFYEEDDALSRVLPRFMCFVDA